MATPESWRRLPKVNSLCKVDVFESQDRSHKRSGTDAPLSSGMGGGGGGGGEARIVRARNLMHSLGECGATATFAVFPKQVVAAALSIRIERFLHLVSVHRQ